MRLALGTVLAAVAGFVHTSVPPPGRIAFAADRAPTSYGEIYRVGADGTVLNLTRSPAVDQFPAASPDGKLVAFVRGRAHTLQVDVVGGDGRGLHAVGPPLAGGGWRDGVAAAISWSPDSRHIAVVLAVSVGSGRLFVTTPGGGWRRIATGVALVAPAWSADSSRLAYLTSAAVVHVVGRDGSPLWRTTGERAFAFSASGLLAVQDDSTTIGIYDRAGRERATFPGDVFAWSGDRLASLRNGLLEIRPNALRPPTLRARVTSKSIGYDARIVWVGRDVVRVRGSAPTWRGYDLRRRKLLAGTQPFDTVWSATGVGAYTKYGSPLAWLVRGTRVARTALSCNSDEPFQFVQFLGRTNSLVYQGGCGTPSEDIYTVAPDGTALTRVTSTPTDEFTPTLSPDGTHVAYSEQPLATFCKGCPHDLWVTPGGQLTNNGYDDAAPMDDAPSFSPDGKTIVFEKSGPSTNYTLHTIPVTGGSSTSLGVVGGTHPAWGAAGIAFVQGYQPTLVRVIDPGTGSVKTLATVAGQVDVGPLTWAPDGRLAYLRTDAAGRSSIVVVGGRTIALAQSRVWGLAWSPDGTRFAFVGDDANGWGEVFTIGVDGGGLQQVTHDLNVQGNLSWR